MSNPVIRILVNGQGALAPDGFHRFVTWLKRAGASGNCLLCIENGRRDGHVPLIVGVRDGQLEMWIPFFCNGDGQLRKARLALPEELTWKMYRILDVLAETPFDGSINGSRRHLNAREHAPVRWTTKNPARAVAMVEALYFQQKNREWISHPNMINVLGMLTRHKDRRVLACMIQRLVKIGFITQVEHPVRYVISKEQIILAHERAGMEFEDFD